MKNFKDVNGITIEEANKLAEKGLYLIIRSGRLKGFTTK